MTHDERHGIAALGWLIALLAAACIGGFALGVAAGYMAWKTEPAPVVPCPKQMTFKDMTNKQIARWQRWRESEAKGWIVK